MTVSLHTASVPVFNQLLGGLADVLKKAEAHATERKIDPNAYLQSRLYPDMFPLLRQVQIACDFAKSVSARLAQAEVPAWEDNEASFEDLQSRIARTQAFIASLDAASFEGAESRDIVLRPGTPKEKKLTGHAYLLNYGLPQFFFHVTTAYALLRHAGIEIGKRDFMGQY
ncbi:MAG: DUF1993 domain-containing protein [Arenimonas sp.]|nr:DUF1993 domain-containing protein [Arenimonas sp.]